MTLPYDREKREFIRVGLEIPIRYKFICEHIKNPLVEKIYKGKSTNIGAGGLLLAGEIPDFNWIPDMLLQKIVIGMNFLLPREENMIKVLGRAAWIGSLEEEKHQGQMGLKFVELTSEDKDRIMRFVIRLQIPS